MTTVKGTQLRARTENELVKLCECKQTSPIKEVTPPKTLQDKEPEMKLTFSERHLIEGLRFFENDRCLKHLPDILIKMLAIYKKRDSKYNRTGDCYSNTFGDGDAEAFINCKRNFERIKDIVHDGNNHLECHVPMQKFEESEILEDQLNYMAIWMCNRRERRRSGIS